ncbi:MAG TPA: hypothetical protein VHC97_23535 [Thermoanaerobaculia bacterium]|jgi:hypothetical protein|nr:hypothetical protein [Thermoanaerobaculia bacterium]
MGLGEALKERGRRLWAWFFPPRVPLPGEVERILRALYPCLDLSAVSFHLGLPHFARWTGGVAITIPALLAPRRTRVYVSPRHWDVATAEGIGTLAHEAYHALQVQESGWGIGPLRPFLVLYFACGAANGFRYEGHPLEVDAYRLVGRRRSPFESALWRADVERIERESARFATPSCELRFWRKLAASTPLVRRLVDSRPPADAEPGRLWLLALVGFLPISLWLLLWGLAASVVWLARLLVESVGAAAAGLLWGAGLLLSSFEVILAPGRAGR